MMSEGRPVQYRPPAASTYPFILGFGALVGLVMLVVAATSGGPWWFVLIVLAVLGWNAYNYLIRSARNVSIRLGTLSWTGWFRSEQVPLDQIVRVSLRLGGAFQVVECRDGRKLWISIAQGYRPFGEALAEALPDIPVDLGGYSRFVDRMRVRRKPPEDRT
jgi:hypothetical protein